MSVISKFYGMTVKVFMSGYYKDTPRIYVLYGDYVGVIEINTAVMIEGDLPETGLQLVQEWIQENQHALDKMWETQHVIAIPPLE